jgi:hypothetical protein
LGIEHRARGKEEYTEEAIRAKVEVPYRGFRGKRGQRGVSDPIPAVKNGCTDYCLDYIFFDLWYAILGTT